MKTEAPGPVPPPARPRRRARAVAPNPAMLAIDGPMGALCDAALAARAQGSIAILALASIAQDPDAPATARVAAAAKLLERGFGRTAPETGAAGSPDLFDLSDAELEALLAEANANEGASAGGGAGDAGPG